MSLTQLRDRGAPTSLPRVTADVLLQKKRAGQPITALTAYDFPTARLVDEAGIDLVLVGDSVGMAVLGYENTLPVTMEEMLHHTRAVSRGVRHALLVADMPYGSYQASIEDGIRNATRFMKESGAQAVKIEGGHKHADLVARLRDAEIPVIGHIGLTPQSVHRMGGYRVQGRSTEAMDILCAAVITARSAVPTIGIGAGPDCDGQILVFHDLFNLTFSPAAKFSRQYADGAAFFSRAIEQYRDDVAGRYFPSDAESYHLPREVQAERIESDAEEKHLCKA